MNTLLVLATLLSVAYAGNLTVTDMVWMEFEVKDLDGPGVDYRGRIKVALFGEAAPITVLNFKTLSKGYKKGGTKIAYRNSPVHRVVPDFIIQMGDITNGDGSGGISIYGEKFNDEDFTLSHVSAGWLAMANHGKDTNGSQFYITLTKARWLDGNHVVFGKVVEGYDVLRTLGDVPSDKFTALPKKRMRIVDSGVEDIDKYDMQESDLTSEDDANFSD